MTKNTKGIIWASVAMAMIIVCVVTYIRQRPHHPVTKAAPPTIAIADIPSQTQITTSTEAATSSPVMVATSTATSTLPSKVIARKPKKTPSKLSYTDAVAKYGFFRIQFSPGCLEAHPNQIAAANPVTLMLDNRSDKTQIFMIAGAIYSVNAYDYAIVTVNEKALPMNIGISCNEQKNVAQIILQK